MRRVKKPKMQTVFVDRRALALREMTNDEDKRYCLSRLHIEPDGTAVATDGRSMICLDPMTYDPSDWPSNMVRPARTAIPLNIPKKVAADLSRAIPKSVCKEQLNVAVLTSAGETVEFATTDLSRVKREGYVVRKDDRPWPEHWPEMLEHPCDVPDPVAEIDVDAKTLSSILRTMISAGGDRGERFAVCIKLFGPTKPMHVEARVSGDRDRKMHAVVAPVRVRKDAR